MRLWSTRTTMEADPPAAPADGVVEAVDAALGFVIGQRRVPGPLAVALIEGVRDIARDVDGGECFDDRIEAALSACGGNPILGARLTDLLLDIRNAVHRRESGLTAAETRVPGRTPDARGG